MNKGKNMSTDGIGPWKKGKLVANTDFQFMFSGIDSKG